ncbi:hydroxypyruvate isomerase family protein [Botrimarina hoheduenensis]|uniref:Hydroxypyruvate isomerase n=1 Tax=Botrimarina hoheduenensis TaxID=2528000 RepID=A0A5C5W8T3_9BACT|nr:TIM barrel protein [Botrimarina hoheduenensis]TWT46673.1 Hydroxypyruvate isomerase [Botrimarina hoheduenensis]
MQRRNFLAAAATAAATAVTTSPASAQSTTQDAGTKPFRLRYAPHFGLFRNAAGNDLVAQLEFAAAQGFRDWEDNTMHKRPVEEQTRIAAAMERLGIRMGVFVAYGVGSFDKRSFTGSDKKLREEAVAEVRASVEVAKRVNAKWMTVVPGAFSIDVEEGYQTARCIDLLRRCAEVLEPHDLVMVLEPLNWWKNHAGLFLRKIPQAYEICRGVDSPACKILFDVYHQQIQEGNLIPNIDLAWDEIAYFQVGDNPGRNEPGTGEINYRNVFKHLHTRGFDGVVGMEHGASRGGKEGDLAVIEAYRTADAF